jgi:hypothetical protein
LLKVARFSYCAWCEGEAVRRLRQAADDALAHEITLGHLAYRHLRHPAHPRRTARLGRRVNRKSVARVMRERDIRGVPGPGAFR